MQFHFNGDSNLYGFDEADKDFEFPTNIKQMGCIEDGIKIYMEDYVYTYLYQYAKTAANKEKLAALVGRHVEAEGKDVIVISGAIQGKHTVHENGVESFTKESWEYINKQMDVYFKGLSIVGWAHTQPCFGAFLMSRDEDYHRSFFPMPWQVLYVLDPVERLDGFFVHNSERTGLRPAKGYLIYYSKNENMHEYMIDNSIVKAKLAPQEDVLAEDKMEAEEEELSLKDRFEKSFKKKDTEGEGQKEKRIIKKEIKTTSDMEENDRIDAAKKIRKVLNEKAEANTQEKKKLTMLAGVSGVLCMACLVMGASLIHSQDRLQKLETEVSSVKVSYTAMEEQLNNTQMVFAQSQEKITQLEREKEESEKIKAQEDERIRQEEAAKKAEEARAKEDTAQTDTKTQNGVSEEGDKTAPTDGGDKVSAGSGAVPEYYMVEAGDNLGYISTKFYGSNEKVAEILELNQMSDPDKIFFGQKLLLPQP